MEISDISEITDEFLYKKGFCGLQNLGNTCFMNSILQCLNNTQPLLKYLFSENFTENISSNKSGALTLALKEVMKNLWYKNAVYSPVKFLRTLQMLSLEKNRFEFSGLGQNDSQEFLQFILEILQESLSKEIYIEIEGEPEDEYDEFAIKAYNSYKKFFEKDYSEIIEIFYGQYFTQIETATKDKYEKSYSFEPFNMLSIEIPTNSKNLYECLDNFSSIETVIEDDTRKIIKKVLFWTLPNVLIIFLKRYNNNLEKIDKFLDFPIDNLDMSKYVKGYNRESYKYSLYGISNHGGGLGGGHYWSYIKNIDGEWYKFNDNLVSTISLEKVVSENAYCLFYKKND